MQIQLPLTSARNGDGSSVTPTPTTTNFGLVTGLRLSLATENAPATGTVTNTALWEIVLPDDYTAGENIAAVVTAGRVVSGGGATQSYTLALTASEIDTKGDLGANLVTPGAQPLLGGPPDVLSFTIDGASLFPGTRLMAGVVVALTSDGAVAAKGSVYSVVLTS